MRTLILADCAWPTDPRRPRMPSGSGIENYEASRAIENGAAGPLSVTNWNFAGPSPLAKNIAGGTPPTGGDRGEEVAVIADVFYPSYSPSKALTSGGRLMRMHRVISHGVIGCAGVIAGYFVTTGHLAIMPSFAQTPAAGQRSTELFNRVMEDVSGRRLTVRLTERDPGNGSAAHRHPGSHTVGYILEGTYEVKIDEGPVRTLKPGEVFYEAPNALHAVSREAQRTCREHRERTEVTRLTPSGCPPFV
jgi:quercetin dioxygenase-like cupin family protein